MKTLDSNTRARRRALLCASASAMLLALGAQPAWAVKPVTATVDTAQPSYDENSPPLQQNPVVFEGGTFKPSGTPNIVTVAAAVTLDTPGGTVDASNAGVAFSGAISGPGALHIVSSTFNEPLGYVALAQDETYGGGTTIGTNSLLQLGTGGTTGSVQGAITNNGWIIFSRTNDVTLSNTISGSGDLGVSDPITVTLTANNTDNGALALRDSTVQIGNGGTTGAWGDGPVVDGGSLVFDRSDDITYAGAIQDFDLTHHGSLTQAGGGTLTLTANNTYSNGTTIDAGGVLQLGNGGTTGSIVGDVTNNGTLKFDHSNGASFGGAISGSGGLTIGQGTLTLSGTNTFTGNTAISAGASLKLTGTGSIADSSDPQVDGTFDISGASADVSVTTLSGASTGKVILGNNTLVLTAASETFAGVISGAGGLTIAGGTETLTGANSFTGKTLIDSGATLQLGDGAGGGSVVGAIQDNGHLKFDFSDSQTLTGKISGTGDVEAVAGTTVIASADDSPQLYSVSGDITIDAGATLTMGNGKAAVFLNGDKFIDNGTLAIDFGKGGQFAAPAVITGTGALEVKSGNFITYQTNTYTGVTTIDTGGHLVLGGSGSISDSAGVVDDGVFDISQMTASGTSITTLSGSGLMGMSNTLTLTAAAGDFSGEVRGGGELIIAAGTETFSGFSLYFGATEIDSGATMKLSDDGALANSTVVDSGTLDISGATSGNTMIGSLAGKGDVTLGSQTLRLTNAGDTFSGVLSGEGGGLEVAAGTETLTGINTFTGKTLIDASGTLKLSGAGSIEDSADPQVDGTFDISGASGAVSVMSLSGASTGKVLLGGNTLILTSASETFNGVISGSGGLTVSGGSESLAGANTYTGATSINDGASLNLRGSGSISDSVGVTADGLFDISGTTAGASIKTLSGSGEVYVGSETLTLTSASGTFAGDLSGGFLGGVTIAAGTETLTGPSELKGLLTVDPGATLKLAGFGTAQFAHVVADGTFDISGTVFEGDIGGLSGGGSVTLGSRSLVLNSASDSFGGVISGSGGVELSRGSQALYGVNTYSGETRVDPNSALFLIGAGSIAKSQKVIDNGDFNISGTTSGASIKSLAGGGFVELGGKTLTLTAAADTFSGAIAGKGGVHLRARTETLAGSSTYTGQTLVDAGATLALVAGGEISDSSLVTVNGVLDISGFVAGARAIKVDVLDDIYGPFEGVLPLSNGPASDTLSWSSAGFHISASIGLTDASGALEAVIFTSGDDVYELEGPALGGSFVGTPCASSPADACVVLSQSPKDLQTVIASLNGGRGICCGTSSLLISETLGARRPEIRSLAGSGSVLLGDNTLVITAAGSIFAGSISGAGGLKIDGGTQGLAGDNTYTGFTTIKAGATLALIGAGSIADSAKVKDNGVFDISGTTSGASIVSLAGNGQVRLGSESLTLTDAADTFGGDIEGTGGLTVAGGAETLTGVDGYSGLTTIDGGARLNLSGAGSIANSSVEDDGVFDVSATNLGGVIKSLSGDGRVFLSTGGFDLYLTGASGLFSGVISGNGGFYISGGTEALSGVDIYTGPTGVAAGAELDLKGAGSIADSALVVVNGGGTLDISGASGDISFIRLGGGGQVNLGSNSLILTAAQDDFAGAISGKGGLTIAGGTEVLIGDNSFTGPTTIDAGAGLQLGAGGSTGSVASDILDNGALVFDYGVDMLYGRSISGAGSMTVASTAGHALVLTGASTYTGGTTIGAGALLYLGFGGTTGSILGDVADNGTLVFDRSDAVSFGGTISGSGGLTVTGGGSVTLTADNSFTGLTGIDVGARLQLGDGGTAGAIVGDVLDNGNLVFDRSVAMSLGGTIAGAGGVAVVGPSAVTFTADNSYTGGTTIAAGSLLQLGSGGATGSIVGDVADNGVLVFDRSDAVGLAGVISGSGAVSVTGGGTVVLTGENTYTGSTDIFVGATLQIGAGGTSGAIAGAVINNGLLVFDRSDAVSFGELISGSGALNVTGGGSLTLTAENLFTGPTGVDAGSILQLGAGGTSGGVASSIITDLGRVIFDRSNAVTWAGLIQGSGAATIGGTGPVTFTGANTHTGGTTIDAGATLKLGVGGTSGSVAGNILDNGALVFNRSDVVMFNNVISGTGSLTQGGAGTLILNNVDTVSGRTTVAAGTLEVGDAADPGAVLDSHLGGVLVNAGATLKGHGTILGAVTNNGVVAPGGSIGTLTVASFSQGPGGTLSIELTPTDSSQLHVIGAATLGGTLALAFDAGTYGPHVYSIITAGSVSGTFANVAMTGTQAGLVYGVGYTATGVQLIEAPTSDANIYGQVTQATLDRAESFASLVEDSFGQAVCASGAAAAHADDCNGMMAWAKVIGSSDHVNATSSGVAFTNKGAGALGGIEKGWAGGLTLGVALGYTENNLRINAANASASGRSYYAAVYGRLAQGPLQLDGQGFWMKTDWPLRRAIAGYGTASSNPDGDSEGFLVQASTPLGTSGLRPYLRFTYAHFGRNAASETGVGMLGFDVAGGGAEAAVGEAGFIFDPASVSLGSARVFPTLRLGIQQDFASRPIPIAASLSGVAGTSFTTAYDKPGRTTGVADFALKARLNQSFDLTGDIRSRFGGGQSEAAATFGGAILF